MLNRILAVVPARGGSKGLPGKNLARVEGVTLLEYAIRFARAVRGVERVLVSTDDEEIAGVARAVGAEAPFLRSASLSQDDTPMAPVLRHALCEAEALWGPHDGVLLAMPTVPFRDPGETDRAIDALDRHPDADGIVSVSAPSFHPDYVGVRQDDDGRLVRRGDVLHQRQAAGAFLRLNGAFYVFRAPFVRRVDRDWLGEGVHLGWPVDDRRLVDVDTPEDLDWLRTLVAAGVLPL